MTFSITERKFVLTDNWYGKELSDIATPLNEKMPIFLSQLVMRFKLTRAIAMLVVGRDYQILVTSWHDTGRYMAIISSLFGMRKNVHLEFIDFNYKNKKWPISFGYGMIVKYILTPCLRRSCLGVQVLTDWEKCEVAKNYKFPGEKIRLISWPLILGEVKNSSANKNSISTMVFSSGRAACDWKTLFAAFRIGNWPLTVVCTKADLALVNELNYDNKAIILHDISKTEHDKYYENATVYALCLKETHKSTGQIRLACGIEAGVPVVATNVRGLDGYLIDGVTAVSVPVGDAQSLSSAIIELLSDANLRSNQASKALAYAELHTRKLYMQTIKNFIYECFNNLSNSKFL